MLPNSASTQSDEVDNGDGNDAKRLFSHRSEFASPKLYLPLLLPLLMQAKSHWMTTTVMMMTMMKRHQKIGKRKKKREQQREMKKMIKSQRSCAHRCCGCCLAVAAGAGTTVILLGWSCLHISVLSAHAFASLVFIGL